MGILTRGVPQGWQQKSHKAERTFKKHKLSFFFIQSVHQAANSSSIFPYLSCLLDIYMWNIYQLKLNIPNQLLRLEWGIYSPTSSTSAWRNVWRGFSQSEDGAQNCSVSVRLSSVQRELLFPSCFLLLSLPHFVMLWLLGGDLHRCYCSRHEIRLQYPGQTQIPSVCSCLLCLQLSSDTCQQAVSFQKSLADFWLLFFVCMFFFFLFFVSKIFNMR